MLVDASAVVVEKRLERREVVRTDRLEHAGQHLQFAYFAAVCGGAHVACARVVRIDPVRGPREQ